MELKENTVLYKSKTQKIKVWQGVVTIDPGVPNWVGTDERGATILEAIDGALTFGQLVQVYAHQFSIDFHRAWRHCDFFIREALRSQMLSLKPPQQKSYRGRASVLKPQVLREFWLHTNNSCNLACTHCLVSSSRENLKGLETSQYKGVVDEAKNLGVERFYFTGGEPLIREDFFELASYVTKDSELILLTNGVLMDEKRCKHLRGYSPERLKIQISLDGSCPEVNDPIRGRGSFQSIVEGIRNALSTGLPVTVSTVVTNRNVEDIPNITRMIAGLGVSNHHLLWVHTRGRILKTRVRLTAPPGKRTIRMLKKLIRIAKELGVTIDNLESIKTRVNHKVGTKLDLSNACYHSLCLYADGGIYPSASFAGFTPLCLGNIKQANVLTTWEESLLAKKIRSLSVVEKASCRQCVFKFICGGGDLEHTFFHSYVGNGYRQDLFQHFKARDPYCHIYRFLMREAMDRLLQVGKLVNRSGFDAPYVIHAMGEGSVCCMPGAMHHRDEDSEVETVHSNCVLSFDLDKTRDVVRQFYAWAATEPQKHLCCPQGYSTGDTSHIPKAVLDVSYGCGSPVNAAEVKSGDVVVDLGCGGGIDCFVASKYVGSGGRVVGVDMTEEMLVLANQYSQEVAANLGYANVEFRKGYLEDIPVEDRSANLVISNCVINLSPDKKKVFGEIWRILKDHGRMVVSDIVSEVLVPSHIGMNPRLWGECISGALTQEAFFQYLEQVGFYGISLLKKTLYREVEGYKFYSVTIRAYKYEKKRGCVYKGQKAIYHGPFQSIMDEESHLFPRNVAVEVCTDTAQKLSNPPYNMGFTVIDSKGKVEAACCSGEPGTPCCIKNE